MVLICLATVTPQQACATSLDQKKRQTREKIKRINFLKGLKKTNCTETSKSLKTLIQLLKAQKLSIMPCKINLTVWK